MACILEQKVYPMGLMLSHAVHVLICLCLGLCLVRRNVFLQLDAQCLTVSVIRDMLCIKSS